MKKHRLKLALAAFAIVGMISTISCKKETNNSGEFIVSNMVKTECLNVGITSQFSSDSIIVSHRNQTIFIQHYNHVINCGHEIDINVTTTNDTIWIKEIDFGEEANCLCTLNNSYQIDNVREDQQYLVIIENCSRNSQYENCNVVYNQTLNS